MSYKNKNPLSFHRRKGVKLMLTAAVANPKMFWDDFQNLKQYEALHLATENLDDIELNLFDIEISQIERDSSQETKNRNLLFKCYMTYINGRKI